MFKKIIRRWLRRKDHHIKWLYKNGFIDYFEYRYRDAQVRLQYDKWVHDECHHFCKFCTHYMDCLPLD